MSHSQFPTAFVRPNVGSVRITRLLVTQSGTYNQMYLRPYQTHFDHEIADELNTRLETNMVGGTVVGQTTAGLMSGIASKIIMPSAQPQGAIPIVNGWLEKRGRFNMVVEVNFEHGAVHQYYIQGYTNHYDLTLSGQIDPNTEFYINSFIRINRQHISTPNGIRAVDSATEAAQVINGRLLSSQTNTNVYGMRPNELYTVMQSDNIQASLYNYEDRARFTDDRYNFSNKTVRSTRSNNVPANMLSRIVDSYQVGQSMLEFGDNNSDVFTRSKANVYEEDLVNNPFFRRLSDVVGIPNAVSFTLNQLLKIDSNALNAAQFIRLNEQGIRKINHAGSSEQWHNPNDRSAWLATVLVNCIPTIMMDMMLTAIQFSATNHDTAGNNIVIITGALDLFGRNLNENGNVFKNRFIREIMHDATYGNQELYSLSMTVDLFGDTVMDISIGSSPITRYVAPSFCDSLLAPVITQSENNLRESAGDISNILMSINNIPKSITINEGI